MTKGPFDLFPHIVTEELTLRKIIPTDAVRLHEIYSNKQLFQYTPNMYKKNLETVAKMVGHFERDFNKKKWLLLGIALNSEPDSIVGVAEMFDYESNIDMITIGYRLNEHFWGQGIATKTVKAMTDYLFLHTEINRIQAYVMPENTKSLHVLERNHYVREGTIRQGHFWKGKGIVDLELFALLRSDYDRKCGR